MSSFFAPKYFAIPSPPRAGKPPRSAPAAAGRTMDGIGQSTQYAKLHRQRRRFIPRRHKNPDLPIAMHPPARPVQPHWRLPQRSHMAQNVGFQLAIHRVKMNRPAARPRPWGGVDVNHIPAARQILYELWREILADRKTGFAQQPSQRPRAVVIADDFDSHGMAHRDTQTQRTTSGNARGVYRDWVLHPRLARVGGRRARPAPRNLSETPPRQGRPLWRTRNEQPAPGGGLCGPGAALRRPARSGRYNTAPENKKARALRSGVTRHRMEQPHFLFNPSLPTRL